MIGLFASGATASLVAKNGTKKNIPLLRIKSPPVNGFWCLRCLNAHLDMSITMGPNRFGLAGLPMAAIFDFQMSKSQLFEELHGWNLEFKLITPKSNTGTNFYTKLSRVGLACSPLAAILDFHMSISEPFEELHGWNLEFMLIIPKSITGTYFDAMAAILDFVKRPYISCLKSYRAENWNIS